jgi:alkylation response protein AidB-like acyl-CoA dehydrogenase
MMKARSAHTQAQRFVLDEEERIVRDSAHAFATARMPIRQIRAIRDSATAAGFDLGVWAELAALGWAGMAVSEEFGGAGLGIRALAAVIEKMGETLGAAPLASTALVAATVIARFAPAEVAARWLPKIARGQVVAALAVDEADHAWDERLSTTLDSEVIDGAKRYVADGVAANLLLVSAMKGEAPVLALVHADAPGVAVRRLDTIDGRGLADIEFQRVHVDAVLTPTTCAPGDSSANRSEASRPCSIALPNCTSKSSSRAAASSRPSTRSTMTATSWPRSSLWRKRRRPT